MTKRLTISIYKYPYTSGISCPSAPIPERISNDPEEWTKNNVTTIVNALFKIIKRNPIISLDYSAEDSLYSDNLTFRTEFTVHGEKTTRKINEECIRNNLIMECL